MSLKCRGSLGLSHPSHSSQNHRWPHFSPYARPSLLSVSPQSLAAPSQHITTGPWHCPWVWLAPWYQWSPTMGTEQPFQKQSQAPVLIGLNIPLSTQSEFPFEPQRRGRYSQVKQASVWFADETSNSTYNCRVSHTVIWKQAQQVVGGGVDLEAERSCLLFNASLFSNVSQDEECLGKDRNWEAATLMSYISGAHAFSTSSYF